jgi:hypothetical protein
MARNESQRGPREVRRTQVPLNGRRCGPFRSDLGGVRFAPYTVYFHLRPRQKMHERRWRGQVSVLTWIGSTCTQTTVATVACVATREASLTGAPPLVTTDVIY